MKTKGVPNNMVKGKFYFLPILFDSKTNELRPQSPIFGFVLTALIWFHQASSFILDFVGIEHEPDFPIEVNNERDK